MIELTIVCALLVALNAWQQWDRRAERHEVAQERQVLLNRIQAPDIAMMEQVLESAGPNPPEVGWEDDEAFHKTKDQLADEL